MPELNPVHTKKSRPARWVEATSKQTLSPLGESVAEILDFVFKGIHNAPISDKKTEWSNPRLISVNCWGGLCTTDSDALTRLVLAAHDRCVRIEIKPCNPGYVRLNFSQRQRVACGMEGHPTMEQAVEKLRGRL